MSLDTTNVLFSLIFLNQRKVARDKALAASVGAGLVGGPVGLILPLVVAGGIKKGDPTAPPADAGDKYREVPEVVGRTAEAASELVTTAHLTPVPAVFETNEKDPGIVVDQKPPGGELLVTGSDVTIIVARAPEALEQTEEEKEDEILKFMKENLAISKQTLEKVEKHVGGSSTSSSASGRSKNFEASSGQALMERSSEPPSAGSTGKKEPGKS